jgi:hypothetical protein
MEEALSPYNDFPNRFCLLLASIEADSGYEGFLLDCSS